MIYRSPIGYLHIESNGRAITALHLTHNHQSQVPVDNIEKQAVAWLDAYFNRLPLPPMPPLHPEGSEFRKKVWREMCRVPFGTTISYGELARRTGSSPRAVGGAVGANPIALMMPCHRIIAADGSIGGFAYGADCKRFLLNLECDTQITLP